jgi:type IV secretory pathway TrbD component
LARRGTSAVLDEKGGLMYIGAGTLAVILIIVLLIWIL